MLFHLFIFISVDYQIWYVDLFSIHLIRYKECLEKVTISDIMFPYGELTCHSDEDFCFFDQSK